MAGVTKAGTSSLFWYLIQHPDICPPSDRKEIDFFTPLRYGKPTKGTLGDYSEYFAHCAGHRYRLDASPHYFDGGPPVIEAIRESLPDVFLIVILRDPVKRFWSTFRNRKEGGNLGREVTFAQYFEECVAVHRSGRHRSEEFRHYRSLSEGVYIRPLREWFDSFDEQVRVFFFEDLVERPNDVVADVCNWLEVDIAPAAHFDFAARNKTVDPRSVRLSQWAHRLNFRVDPMLRRAPAVKELARRGYEVLNGRKQGEVLSEAERLAVRRFYEPANRALYEELTRRGYTDLPPWLQIEAFDGPSQWGRPHPEAKSGGTA